MNPKQLANPDLSAASYASMKVLWGVPILFAAHNIEEAVLTPTFLRSGKAPPFFQDLASRYDSRLFVLVLIALTVFPFVIAIRGDLKNRLSRSSRFLVVLQTIFFANAIWHISVALALRRYAPGVFTALFCQIPFSLWLLSHAWKERWIYRSTMVAVWCIAIGFQTAAFMTTVLPR